MEGGREKGGRKTDGRKERMAMSNGVEPEGGFRAVAPNLSLATPHLSISETWMPAPRDIEFLLF